MTKDLNIIARPVNLLVLMQQYHGSGTVTRNKKRKGYEYCTHSDQLEQKELLTDKFKHKKKLVLFIRLLRRSRLNLNWCINLYNPSDVKNISDIFSIKTKEPLRYIYTRLHQTTFVITKDCYQHI